MPRPPDQVNLVKVADALDAAGRLMISAAQALRGGNGSELSQSLTPSRGPENLPVAPDPSKPVALPVASQPLTIRQIVAEFLAVKTRALRSKRYLRQLRVSLGSFSEGRSNSLLSAVKVQDVEAWLYGHKWETRTMRNYLNDLRALLTWSKRRGYIHGTDAGAAELPAMPAGRPPGIHTPDQVRQVLETARRVDVDVMRHLAVRYFAGVRSAECHRLREEDIRGGFVDVPGSKAKTRSRRVVKIQPNLEAWLALGGTLRPLGIMTVRKVVKKAGVPWPHNVTRHSFVSYHLAMWSRANETALEAGHTEQMLFANYRHVVLPSQAREFWEIVPKTLARE